jgi:MFS family permease
LALSALYLAIVGVLPPNLFWSPDEGAKYLQLTRYRGQSPRVRQQVQYGARPFDPSYRFYPQPLPPGHRFELVARLYPRPSADGTVRTNWPPLFGLLSMPLFSAFGFYGLYLLPLAAGIGTAVLAGALARRVAPDAEVAVILAVGLCTPVLFYSCLFWEHTIAVFLGMASLVLCSGASRTSPRALLAAAACLGLAIALRFEMAVFASALAAALIAAALRDRLEASGRASARALRVGTAATIAALGTLAFGVAAIAIRRLEPANLIGDKEGSLAQLLVGLLSSPRLWRELPVRLRQALVDLPADNGPTLEPWIAWLGLLGVLVAAASIALREPARGRALVAGGGLLTLVSLWAVVSPDRFRSVHALVLPAPYMVFAVLLLFLPRGAGGRALRIFGGTMVIVLASSTVLSLPLLVGGLEWGNRYQLIAYVLAAAGCAVGMVSYGKTGGPARPRAAVAAAAGIALAVGGLYQMRGLRELAITKADLHAYRHELNAASQPVVTELYWLPSALAETFRRIPMFTLRDPDQLASWIDMVSARAPRFLVVTDELPAAAAGRWRAGAAPHSIELVREQLVAGLVFLEFELDRNPDPAPN